MAVGETAAKGKGASQNPSTVTSSTYKDNKQIMFARTSIFSNLLFMNCETKMSLVSGLLKVCVKTHVNLITSAKENMQIVLLTD